MAGLPECGAFVDPVSVTKAEAPRLLVVRFVLPRGRAGCTLEGLDLVKQKTLELGEVVAAAFDEAARHTASARRMDDWATTAAGLVLERAHGTPISRALVELAGPKRMRTPRAKYLRASPQHPARRINIAKVAPDAHGF